MGSRKQGRSEKPKNHAQDGETLIAAMPAVTESGDPAMVLVLRMTSILPMVRASCPLRPAAGLLLDVLARDRFPKTLKSVFRDHASARTFESPRAG
jgi:hypothetical protein